MDMFANLLIILPSTDRKEFVFGYLIFFQMPVPWEVEVSWQWLMGHFLAKERDFSFMSGLSLLFTHCPPPETFLRDWDQLRWVFRDQEGTFPHLLCWSKPHSPPNRKGLCLFPEDGCVVTHWRKKQWVKKKKRVLPSLDLNCGWEDWDIGWCWKLRCGSI